MEEAKRIKMKTVRKVIGLGLIAIGLGLLFSSIALNVRQHVERQRTLEEFKEYIKSGDAQEHSEGNPAVEGDMLYILRIPSIDSQNPVREGVDRSILADSLGHEPDTCYAGEEGNCVLAGHRNYTFGKFGAGRSETLKAEGKNFGFMMLLK